MSDKSEQIYQELLDNEIMSRRSANRTAFNMEQVMKRLNSPKEIGFVKYVLLIHVLDSLGIQIVPTMEG